MVAPEFYVEKHLEKHLVNIFLEKVKDLKTKAKKMTKSDWWIFDVHALFKTRSLINSRFDFFYYENFKYFQYLCLLKATAISTFKSRIRLQKNHRSLTLVGYCKCGNHSFQKTFFHLDSNIFCLFANSIEQ